MKNNKIKKVVKHVLFIFTFLGNNQLPSELSDLTEADMRLKIQSDMKVTLTYLMFVKYCFAFKMEIRIIIVFPEWRFYDGQMSSTNLQCEV